MLPRLQFGTERTDGAGFESEQPNWKSIAWPSHKRTDHTDCTDRDDHADRTDRTDRDERGTDFGWPSIGPLAAAPVRRNRKSHGDGDEDRSCKQRHGERGECGNYRSLLRPQRSTEWRTGNDLQLCVLRLRCGEANLWRHRLGSRRGLWRTPKMLRNGLVLRL